MNDAHFTDKGQLNGALRPALSDQATITRLERELAEIKQQREADIKAALSALAPFVSMAYEQRAETYTAGTSARLWISFDALKEALQVFRQLSGESGEPEESRLVISAARRKRILEIINEMRKQIE